MAIQTNRRKRAASGAPAAAPQQASPVNGGLAAEIAALRDMLRQAGELREGDLSPAALMRLLDIYSRAAGRLAGLLKMQCALDGEQGAGGALSRILDEVIADITRNQSRYPDP